MDFPFEKSSSIEVTSGGASVTTDYSDEVLSFLGEADAFTISGFSTYESTQPQFLSGTVSYNGQIYFYFEDLRIAMSVAKTFTTFTMSQSNAIVSEEFNATMKISGLEVGDILEFPSSIFSDNLICCFTTGTC